MPTYSVSFRALSSDLIGVMADVLKDGRFVSRTYVAAVKAGALMPLLNEIRREFAAKGVVEAR